MSVATILSSFQQYGDFNLNKLSKDEWDQYYSFPRFYLTNNWNENQLEPFVLQPSLFHRNGVPATVYFTTKQSEDARPPMGLPKCLRHYFKWKISSITPNSIRNCIAFMKFDAIRPSNSCQTDYIGSWCKHMHVTDFTKLEEWRKVNHYPGSFHLGRKDKLWFRLRAAAQKFGPDKFGNFHPQTFVLPQEYNELLEYSKKSPSNLLIIKPPASARGNGIKVINDVAQVAPDNSNVTKPYIVQQYISNPCLLENGQKFDLRIYVLLTSIDPLRLYVYDEGLVRFATTKYTSQEDGLIDQYMHLTNYFINKRNSDYKTNNDHESLHGCKWSLKRFWRYLSEKHPQVDVQELWRQIIDVIVKTVVCCEGPMARLSYRNCKNDYTSYELFGFDILLDENFKPWILEVNITPSLKSESNLDVNVKYAVIKDMFNIAGYNIPLTASGVGPDLSSIDTAGIFFDNRLYSETLTKRDKLRHSRFVKLFKGRPENQSHINQTIDNGSDQQSTQEADSRELAQTNNKEEPEVTAGNNNEPKTQKQNNGISQKEIDDLIWMELTSNGLLTDLTQNDVRVLMLAEDEYSRRGRFQRIFPSPTSNMYMKYFDKPRYYDLLLDAWERKYRNNRQDGISLLSSLATFLDTPTDPIVAHN